ncbi:hypothetical protein [Terriglobus sp. RCC_193]|uniref:hypothetical protein n=1 Tax=Terriglobus sp. RCC_193 TaxID=3239218 RepID=UPI00352555AE
MAECAATPEMAAKAALGGHASGSEGNAGYRLEEVEVDPVLRRAWMRVRRCDMPNAPAVLVPISAPVRMAASITPDAQPKDVAIERLAPEVSHQILVQAGQSVHAFFTSPVMHMEVAAQALQPGSAGQTISLLLKRRPGAPADEPEHRIRGMVRADGSVEVTP